MTNKGPDKIIDELIILESKKSNIKYSFFSKITPIILGFLGLLVGLKSEDGSTECSEFFFFSTILLLGLCVLCSVAVQYSELHYAKKSVDSYKDESIKYIQGKTESETIYVTTKISAFYIIVEKLTLLFLALSIVSLILYSYVLTL
jgi:hypothetical protein